VTVSKTSFRKPEYHSTSGGFAGGSGYGARSSYGGAAPYGGAPYGGGASAYGTAPGGYGYGASSPYGAPAPFRGGGPGTTCTVYVSGLDPQLTELNLRQFFSNCGQIVNVRLCGDLQHPTRFGFVEFTEPSSVLAAMSLTGYTVGTKVIRVEASRKGPISHAPGGHHRDGPAPGGFGGSSRPPKQFSPEDMERVARTVYIGNLDSSLVEESLHAIFIDCGEIRRMSIAGRPDTDLHYAFIEFAAASSVTSALALNGLELAGHQIRISLSKTPIYTGKVFSEDPAATISKEALVEQARQKAAQISANLGSKRNREDDEAASSGSSSTGGDVSASARGNASKRDDASDSSVSAEKRLKQDDHAAQENEEVDVDTLT